MDFDELCRDCEGERDCRSCMGDMFRDFLDNLMDYQVELVKPKLAELIQDYEEDV